jgi:hypothetical protein
MWDAARGMWGGLAFDIWAAGILIGMPAVFMSDANRPTSSMPRPTSLREAPHG